MAADAGADQTRVDYLSKIATLQTTVASLQLQLRHNADQLERLHRLQAAIVSMYVEFRDRSTEDSALRRGAEEERDELASESPLVILDRLRASLRVLLAFKEDFERELKTAVSRQVSEKDATARDLASRLASAQERIRELTTQVSSMRQYQEDAFGREKDLKRASAEHADRLDHEIGALTAKLDERTTQVQGMRTLIQERDDLIRNRDTRLARISQLESQLQLNRLQSQFDLAKVQTASRQRVSQLEKEARKFNRLESENQELRGEIRTLTEQVRSYNSNIRIKRQADTEARLGQALAEAERLRRVLAERDASLRAMEAAQLQSQTQLASLMQKVHVLTGAKGAADSPALSMSFSMQQSTVSTVSAASPGAVAATAAALRPSSGRAGTPDSVGHGVKRGHANARGASPSRVMAAVTAAQQTAASTGAAGAAGTRKRGAAQTGDIASQHLISTYKDRIKEKDAEIEELAKRIRRLLTLQHRSALAQRAWEEERAKHETQIGALRDEVTQLRKRMGMTSEWGAAADTAVHAYDEGGKEDALRDLQNLRAFAMTTSAAYNQLLADKGKRDISFRRSDIYTLEPVTEPRLARMRNASSPEPLAPSMPATRRSIGRPVTASSTVKAGRGSGYGRGRMLGTGTKLGNTYTFGIN